MNIIFFELEKFLFSDCCGGGVCCFCVWDYYYEKLVEWWEVKWVIEIQIVVIEDSVV